MALKQEFKNAVEAALANSAAATDLKNLLAPLSDAPHSVAFTIGAEATNAIAVTIQLSDEDGVDLAAVTPLTVLVTTSAGTAFNANDYTIAATTGAVEQAVADKVLHVLTDATGTAVITLTIVGAATCNLLVVGPTGKNLGSSGTITHA